MTAPENESTNVVEMDAIDIDEWDRDRHTPRAHDTNLAELVRQSTAAETAKPEPVIKALMKTATAHTTRAQRAQPIQNTLVSKAKIDDAWEEPKAAPAAAAPPAVPRTQTSPNTMRRTGAVPIQVPPRAESPKPVALVPAKRAESPKPVEAKRAESPKPVAQVPAKRAESPKPVAQVPAKRAESPKPVAPPKPAPSATKPAEMPRPPEPIAPPPPKPAPVAAKPIEPPSRPSEPEMLPPPPAITPATDFTTREPSVVVDLGAPQSSSPISASPPVVAPPPSVWDRPSIPVPVVARPTPSPDALDASIPQVVTHDQSDRRIRPRSILATVFPTSRSRRTVALAGAGAAVLAIILGFALGGRHATEAAAIAKPSAATPGSPARTTTTPPVAPVRIAAAATPAMLTTTPPVVTSVPPPRKAPVRRIVPRRKPVVVDYDKKPDATAAADHDESLVRARGAYAAGNQHLFAGDAAAAIASYHQALATYPNYVAGYRGLGLAYAQQGDTAAALKAFKTYVKLAPAAKDVALIQKRIARLAAR